MNNLFGKTEINGIRPIDELFDISKVRRNGSVQIKSVKDDKFKNNNVQFRCFSGYEMDSDKTKKVWFGIPVELNPQTSRFNYSKIYLNGNRFFQLENDLDAMTFHILKHFEWVVGSPNFREARYEIYDEETKAQSRLANFEAGFKAADIIRKMTDEEVSEFGRLFALDPLNCSPLFARESLLTTCMKTPKTVTDYYVDMEFTRAKQNFRLAKGMGLITQDVVRGFLLRGIQSIGTQEDDAVRFLMKDLGLFGLLVSEAKEKESKALQLKNKIPAITQPVKAPVQVPVNTSDKLNADIIDLDPIKAAADLAAKNSGISGAASNPKAVVIAEEEEEDEIVF